MAFDFTAAMRTICADVARRLPAFSHVDVSRIGVGFRQTRSDSPDGLQASLTPLRFEGGAVVGSVRGRRYRCAPVRGTSGAEYLYILNFYLPRFLNHAVEEKLTTITHELWHVGPRMDGDLRRHAGRCYAHGSSQAAYDSHAASLAREWLADRPPPGLLALLEPTYDELVETHGRVVGERFRAARLEPIGRSRRRRRWRGS